MEALKRFRRGWLSCIRQICVSKRRRDKNVIKAWLAQYPIIVLKVCITQKSTNQGIVQNIPRT
jgi:hypothetical protein